MKKKCNFNAGRIISLEQQVLSLREIEKLTLIPKSTIFNVIKRLKNRGSIKRKRGFERIPALNNNDLCSLKKFIVDNPKYTLRKLQFYLEESYKKKVSIPKIKKYLNNLNIYAFSPVKKPILSNLNIVKRKELCNKWIFKTNDFWNKVIFSD